MQLIFVSYLYSQNVVVQTLTLGDNATSGDFTFPDDPSASYEKIYMVYQMRCHEAQVGNGGVGCREWDYSCNTFITDDSRVDSLVAKHPDHIIAGYGEQSFPYSDFPTYTRIQYEQTEIVHGNILTTNEANLGQNDFPLELMKSEQQGKMQLLFKADELLAAGLQAGPISDLQFGVLNNQATVNFLKLNIKATAQVELDANAPETTGFTEVFFNTMNFPNSGNAQLNFTTPFEWDGSSNLLIDLSYTDRNQIANTEVEGSVTDFSSMLQTAEKDGYITLNGSGQLDYDVSNLTGISNEITVAFWAKGNLNSLPANTMLLYGADASNNRTLNIHHPWSNSRIYWDCGNAGGTYDRIDKAANLEDFAGKWNHWAFTKNASTGSMKIYLNGTLWHSGTGKTNPIDIESLRLGKSLTNTNIYHGDIDDLQIWDKELDEATIAEWMNRTIDITHPFYNNLKSYLKFNGLNSASVFDDFAPAGFEQEFEGGLNLGEFSGAGIFKNMEASASRPVTNLLQNTYDNNQTINTTQLDSIVNSSYYITEYAVNGTDIENIGSFSVWLAEPELTYDENGTVISESNVATDGIININELTYYRKFPAKYELLSFVTPYGNGLDLGAEGETWWFDVTDYTPILKGEKRLSVEMGGQNQEELDIKFVFVPGTPTREVLDIQNIWPFARGWMDPILNDDVFEPREVPFSADVSAAKIRASITGHGQNGEFISRNHFVNINGGAAEFNFDVWKNCGQNPVYPQGGTWTFARAGWCPGMATDVNEFDITDQITPGQTATIDYGVNGTTMAEANYLVSQQLVTYGPNNYNLDVDLEEILRPTKITEFARINPACDDPIVRVRNNGTSQITSITVEYGVEGISPKSYTWEGSLDFLETTEIVLPVNEIGFWSTGSLENKFTASIVSVNGQSDENANNNERVSEYELPRTLDRPGLELYLLTNNRPNENKLTIRNSSGEVMQVFENLNAASIYKSAIDFPGGCYSLTLEDSGDDGLSYWYWDAVGQNVGSGVMRINYDFNGSIQLPLVNFESEFGGDLHYDFIIPMASSNENLTAIRKFIMYPNPTKNFTTIDIEGLNSPEVTIEIFNNGGQLIQQFETRADDGNLKFNMDVEKIPAGAYQVRVTNVDRVWTRPLMRL